MRAGGFGIERDSFFELLDRLVQKSRFPISPAETDAQLWPVAKLAEHTVENLTRRNDLALFEVGQPQRVRDIKIARREFERRLEFGCGIAKLSAHEPGLAQQL